MLESARDHSPLAEKAYKQERWAERYGTDEYADEKFMALSYARYVEHLAKAAREILRISKLLYYDSRTKTQQHNLSFFTS